MSNPLPFSEDSLNDTFFAESNLGHGSLPWVNGKPDQWSGEAEKQAELLFRSPKDDNLINLLWKNALSSCFRHTLLLFSQMILFRILDGGRASAIFDRHDHLIFFHINCITSSLDMRDSYKRLLRSNGKQPHSWLQQVLRCFNPCWLSFILDDWQSRSQVIIDIGEHSSSSTVL